MGKIIEEFWKGHSKLSEWSLDVVTLDFNSRLLNQGSRMSTSQLGYF